MMLIPGEHISLLTSAVINAVLPQQNLQTRASANCLLTCLCIDYVVLTCFTSTQGDWLNGGGFFSKINGFEFMCLNPSCVFTKCL